MQNTFNSVHHSLTHSFIHPLCHGFSISFFSAHHSPVLSLSFEISIYRLNSIETDRFLNILTEIYSYKNRDLNVKKVMDCVHGEIVFEIKFRFNVHFCTNTLGKFMNLPIPPVMSSILTLLFFSKEDFGLK